MGIWGYIKGWCWSLFGYGLAAVTKINNVRINATQWLSQYMSDEESRSRIGQVATNVAKNAAVYACQEGLKSLPGGALAYQVLVQSIPCEKKFEDHEGEMRALQARVTEPEEINKKGEMKGLQASVAKPEEIIKYEGLERAENHQPCADLKSNVCIKPEDVIRVFMMKEFMGRQFLDDLMVPDQVRRTGKDPK